MENAVFLKLCNNQATGTCSAIMAVEPKTGPLSSLYLNIRNTPKTCGCYPTRRVAG